MKRAIPTGANIATTLSQVELTWTTAFGQETMTPVTDFLTFGPSHLKKNALNQKFSRKASEKMKSNIEGEAAQLRPLHPE